MGSCKNMINLFAVEIGKGDTDRFGSISELYQWGANSDDTGVREKNNLSRSWQLNLHHQKLQEKKQRRQNDLPSLNKVINVLAVEIKKETLVVLSLISEM